MSDPTPVTKEEAEKRDYVRQLTESANKKVLEDIVKDYQNYAGTKPAVQPPPPATSITQQAYDKLLAAMQGASNGIAGRSAGKAISGSISGVTSALPYATSSSFIVNNSTGQYAAMGHAGPVGNPGPRGATGIRGIPVDDMEPAWRLVMGLQVDDMGAQRYISKAYLCKDANEARSYFRDDHLDKSFTAVFVIDGNPAEDGDG